jgi:aryl carrier-like protein
MNVPLAQIGRNSSFLRLGWDSISAIQLVARCRAAGLAVSVQDILRNKTMGQLALRVKSEGVLELPLGEELDKPFDLSPIQKMHMQRSSTGREPFSQSFLLRLQRYVSGEALVAAVTAVVEQRYRRQ